MKHLLPILALLCWACAKPVDQQAEQAAIKQLLEDETRFAAGADSSRWAACWLQSEEASFLFTNADGAQSYSSFNTLASAISSINPFELTLRRENFSFVIGDDVAYVSFDQQDNWGGAGERKTKESRTLKKEDGQWKILHSNVIEVSSFERANRGSWHMLAESIPPNAATKLQNVSGMGGMSVGYVAVPAGTDFSPFFTGLPYDMCTSPHWGYMLEGAVRIKYQNGMEEIVKAGEVFYWPAPHTAIVEKNSKFIDFSPDREFIPLMEHVAVKLASQPVN